MIISAAIKYENEIFTGLSHREAMNKLGDKIQKPFYIPSENQGFLTDEGIFLSRQEAAIHALSCGQIERLKYNSKLLYSEDLW